MSGFLAEVVRAKRREIAERTVRRPAARIAACLDASAPVRDFAAALARGGVIAELKARTPTRRSFRWSDRLDELALRYERAGAVALSVVVDETRFGTSIETLARVRPQVSLPVLAKDFVIDPYQILALRSAGADAVLLIARLVDPSVLRELVRVCRDVGVAPLVEVHDACDLSAALAAGAQIVGINHRDLDRLELTEDAVERLVPLVPPSVVVVAESGIRDERRVARLSGLGVRAFLVGTALLDAEDPESLLRGMAAAARGAVP